MTSSTGWTYPYQSVPRKVVEKTVERKFDENGNCIWEKVTETERLVHDSPTWPYWNPTVTYTGSSSL